MVTISSTMVSPVVVLDRDVVGFSFWMMVFGCIFSPGFFMLGMFVGFGRMVVIESVTYFLGFYNCFVGVGLALRHCEFRMVMRPSQRSCSAVGFAN